VRRVIELLKHFGLLREDEHVAPLHIKRSCILIYQVIDQDGKAVFCTNDEGSAEEFVKWYNEEESHKPPQNISDKYYIEPGSFPRGRKTNGCSHCGHSLELHQASGCIYTDSEGPCSCKGYHENTTYLP